MAQPASQQPRILIAGALRDAAHCCYRPGAIALSNNHILAVETPEAIRRRYPVAPVSEWPEHIVLPAMVNAHAHLALSDLGPRPYQGAFIDWLMMVMEQAPREADAVEQAIARGVHLSLEAGVGWVGDICPLPAGIAHRAHAGLGGVLYLECTGIGDRAEQRAEALPPAASELNGAMGHHRGQRLLPGLSPHAPYSTGAPVYDAAARMHHRYGMPLSTHLAETLEEIDFTTRGQGPMGDLLKRIDRWDDRIVIPRCHPIDALEPALAAAPWLLAHCNYLEPRHIALLARCGASVVYCPTASAYFGHPHDGHAVHPYRQLLEAGVNVCLGTDSILCQPPDEREPLGILPQMRLLYQRDGTAPDVLLSMATTRGLMAMQIDPAMATLATGAPARLIAARFDPADSTDPLSQVLAGNAGIGKTIGFYDEFGVAPHGAHPQAGSDGPTPP